MNVIMPMLELSAVGPGDDAWRGTADPCVTAVHERAFQLASQLDFPAHRTYN